VCSRFTKRHQDILTRHLVFGSGARTGRVEEREYSEREKIYMVMVGGELLSVEESRRRDRRSTP